MYSSILKCTLMIDLSSESGHADCKIFFIFCKWSFNWFVGCSPYTVALKVDM